MILHLPGPAAPADPAAEAAFLAELEAAMTRPLEEVHGGGCCRPYPSVDPEEV